MGSWSRRRTTPREDGGFKYNPPSGGPADTAVTGWIEQTANTLLADDLRAVRRMPYDRARRAATTHLHDYIGPYVDDLAQRGGHGGHSAGPGSALASTHWAAPACATGIRSSTATALCHRGERRRRSDVPLHERGLGRQDPHGLLIAIRHGATRGHARPFRRRLRATMPTTIATASSRRTAGLMNPNHYLAVAISYLFTHRPQWSADSRGRQDRRQQQP